MLIYDVFFIIFQWWIWWLLLSRQDCSALRFGRAFVGRRIQHLTSVPSSEKRRFHCQFEMILGLET